MSRAFISLLLSSVWAGAFVGGRSVKIVQEPANYGGLQYQVSNVRQPKAPLKPFRNPALFSGPKHLQQLYGKCFSLTYDGYIYELCPFFNFTQEEQTWRWNAFHGILGIWKEWSIINNTFEAMVMSDGDVCPGGLRRLSKIYFKCGNANSLISVEEPNTCVYKVKFATPLACPLDAFLVYPLLSQELQAEWEEIEKSFYYEELTKQGYEKLRNRMFARAGLITLLEEKSSAVNVSGRNDQSRKGFPVFKSKNECVQAYSNLLHEYQQLQQQMTKNATFPKVPDHSEISNESLSTVEKRRGDLGVLKTIYSNTMIN